MTTINMSHVGKTINVYNLDWLMLSRATQDEFRNQIRSDLCGSSARHAGADRCSVAHISEQELPRTVATLMDRTANWVLSVVRPGSMFGDIPANFGWMSSFFKLGVALSVSLKYVC
eukprot:IDg19489t1